MEGDCCGDVLWLADAAEWGFTFDLLLEIAADEACGMHSLGFDHSWVDGVDANLAGAELPWRAQR